MTPWRRSGPAIAALCCLAALALAAPGSAQAAGEVPPIDLQCGHEPDSGTLRPIATVERQVDTGDETVGVQLILLDGATQLATLGTGPIGAGANGTGEVPLGETLDFTPNAGAYFGDGEVGGPPLAPTKTYTVRVRVTDFGGFGITFGDFSCRPSTCTGVTAHTVDEPLADAVAPALSLFQAETGPESRPADDAACEAVWVPTVLPPYEAGRGFVPQGLALRDDGSALVSGYMWEADGVKTTCRIVGVDVETGATTGIYDFSAGSRCSHAGGIAIDDAGRIWVSDTRGSTGWLILFRRSHLLFSGENPRPVLRKLGEDAEGKKVPGSYLVDSEPGHLWIGTWKADSPGRIYEFTTDYLLGRFAIPPTDPEGNEIEIGENVDVRSVPRRTQGAAFRGAALWAASSRSKWGELKAGGAGVKPFGPGVEEIEFADDGCLWATFEAGSKPYQAKSYPLVARFDPRRILGTGTQASCGP